MGAVRGLLVVAVAIAAWLPGSSVQARLNPTGVEDTVDAVETSVVEPIPEVAEERVVDPVESTIGEVVRAVEDTLDSETPPVDDLADDPVYQPVHEGGDDPARDPEPVGNRDALAPQPVVTGVESAEQLAPTELTRGLAGDAEAVPVGASATTDPGGREWAILHVPEIRPAAGDAASVTPASDRPLIDRFLEWLGTRSPAVQELVGGPLLALEILIRALMSAGSGLVAPAALLGAWLFGLVWDRRGPHVGGRPPASTAESLAGQVRSATMNPSRSSRAVEGRAL